MPEVAAALANWNGAGHVERCLDCLQRQSLPLAAITVVDNASIDGSRETVAAHPAGVRVLANDSNRGYAAGYNRAIGSCQSPLVLILNTDVFLEPGWVAEAAAGLERHPGAAAVTGLLHEHGSGRLISGGFYLRRQVRMTPAPVVAGDLEVFGATGAAALFRREALEAVQVEGQVFDEAYFAYGEDIDLWWRARLLGWSAWNVPAARGEHVGSASLGGRLRFVDKPVEFQRHTLKNRYLTLIKNATVGLLWSLLPSLVLTELALWPYLLARRPASMPGLVRAPVDAVALCPRAWRWRRQIQARRRVGAAGLRPFIRGM